MGCEGERYVPATLPPIQSLSVSVSPPRNPGYECFSCGKKGHWVKECPEKISKNSIPATLPPIQSLSVSVSSPRNPGSECFYCGKKGHWVKECPEKISKNSMPSTPGSTASSSSSSNASFLVVRCPCGKGTCRIITSTTNKNPGRKYYTCPAGRYSDDRCTFFKWCDELVNFKAPMCPCEAGISSLNKETSGPNENRWYFSCCIRKNHGACPFFQWADSQLNIVMNRHIWQNKGSSSPQLPRTSHQAPSTINDKVGTKENLNFEMGFQSASVENSQMEFTSPVVESSEIPQNLPIVTVQSKQDEINNDILVQEAEFLDPTMVKALQVSQPISQSHIKCQQTQFWGHISASGETLIEGMIFQLLGFRVYGWLGRLVFPPSQCLKDPARPAPFFCCVFPSFDPIIYSPEDKDMPDFEHSALLPHTPLKTQAEPPPETLRQDALLSSGVQTEHLEIKNPSSAIHCDDVSGSILRTFGQGLISILENMSPTDFERMLKIAEATFDSLHRLSINCQPFTKSIKEYIDFSSRVVKIEESICKDVSSKEFVDLYNLKKTEFEEISNHHATKVAAYEVSDHYLQALRQEVSRVKDTLRRLEQELPSYEDRNLELQTCVLESSKDVTKSERRMEAACMAMEEALALELEKESLLSEAKTALETARIQLQ